MPPAFPWFYGSEESLTNLPTYLQGVDDRRLWPPKPGVSIGEITLLTVPVMHHGREKEH